MSETTYLLDFRRGVVEPLGETPNVKPSDLNASVDPAGQKHKFAAVGTPQKAAE